MSTGTPRTGRVKYRKLLLSLLFSLLVLSSSSKADVLDEVLDGWDETDDVYATDDDHLGFTSSSPDNRFVFEITGSSDTYCIASDAGVRAAHILVNGEEVFNLNSFEPFTWADPVSGKDVTVQTRGGTGTSCRFWLWVDKDDFCPDVWMTDSTDYGTAGCTPNLSMSITEGIVDNQLVGADNYELTCIHAIENNYVKCQAPTHADLADCMDDSFNNVSGGDDMELYEACQDNTNGVDTESDCDVQTGSSWEFAFLEDTHLNSFEEEIWHGGMPNATFTLYEYNACGTAFFDRDIIESGITLAQIQTKAVVCQGTYDYNVEGQIRGYFPWLGYGSVNVSENYTYGANSCAVGTVCQDSTPTASDNDDLDLNACYVDGGTCYDQTTNQDEQSEDYGGICGMCDNTSAQDDVYWSVAYQSQPNGYYDDNPFNSTTQCQEGEEAVTITMSFVMIIQGVLFVVIIALTVIVVYFLIVTSGLTVLAGAARKAFKDRKEKQFLNTSKGQKVEE